ncbi:hypothetical protein [Nostoc sp.]|uniref:hypothetical protein n=1 Tax=Nostoc sp. TaxID=1180 RepID=UPI002FF7F313
MTKYRQKSSVYFSRLKLLARKFISGRAWKPTDKLFPAEVDTNEHCYVSTRVMGNAYLISGDV